MIKIIVENCKNMRKYIQTLSFLLLLDLPVHWRITISIIPFSFADIYSW